MGGNPTFAQAVSLMPPGRLESVRYSSSLLHHFFTDLSYFHGKLATENSKIGRPRAVPESARPPGGTARASSPNASRRQNLAALGAELHYWRGTDRKLPLGAVVKYLPS